jgi:ATP-dependent Clp protease ATP-binding subunit ClpB
LSKRLRESSSLGITLEITDDAAQMIFQQCYDPAYGARPIKRWLEKNVITALSKQVIRGLVHEKACVVIERASDGGIDGTGLCFRIV